MNFVTLPSISLYKFMAITGLLLYVFCFYKYEAKAIEIGKARVEDNYNLAKDTVEWNNRISSKKDVNTPEARAEFDKLTRQKETIIRLATDRMEANQVSGFYVVGFFVGGCLFVFGCGLWYYRIQKYQDIILKKQAEEQ